MGIKTMITSLAAWHAGHSVKVDTINNNKKIIIIKIIIMKIIIIIIKIIIIVNKIGQIKVIPSNFPVIDDNHTVAVRKGTI